MTPPSTVCLYAGSQAGARPAYREATEAFARLLARSGIDVVFGGGRAGLMGALADAALAEGGRVIGVIPEQLAAREVAHRGLSELHVVGSMHERKALMAELSDAFVALPGGIGTLEEVVEVLTWAQLGVHAKAVALLDADGFYGPFVTFLDHALAQGFIHPDTRSRLVVESDGAALLERLQGWDAPPAPRWLDTDGT